METLVSKLKTRSRLITRAAVPCFRDREILKNRARWEGPPPPLGCVFSSGRTQAVPRLQRPRFSEPPFHLLPSR